MDLLIIQHWGLNNYMNTFVQSTGHFIFLFEAKKRRFTHNPQPCVAHTTLILFNFKDFIYSLQLMCAQIH